MIKTLVFEEDSYGNLKHITKKGTELSVVKDKLGDYFYTYNSKDDLKWKDENPFLPSTYYPEENFFRDTYATQTEAMNSLLELLDEIFPQFQWDWMTQADLDRDLLEKERDQEDDQ